MCPTEPARRVPTFSYCGRRRRRASTRCWQWRNLPTTFRISSVVCRASHLRLPVRLARAVLKLARAAECGDGPVRVVISQRELSRMVGVSRESTNKQLRTWQKRGWIRLDHAAITVLMPARCRGSRRSGEGPPARRDCSRSVAARAPGTAIPACCRESQVRVGVTAAFTIVSRLSAKSEATTLLL